ncbi:MAG TPA: HU family DNA-binding protein [Firmicutes bacterium]|nr:HU family DNA-binding protein [Bacillota bacterium]
MNKAELVDSVAQKVQMTKKDVGMVVDSALESISEALATGDRVQLTGFGTFEVREREERRGRNPQTGTEIIIPARKAPVFRPGKALKELLQ